MRDVVVVGAGHNALVAGCYLARGGLDVEVVERRPMVGGAVSTVAALGVAAGLAWCYLLPPAAAVIALARGRPGDARAGLAGYAAGVAGRAVAARRTGGRAGDAVAHPASVAAFIGLLGASWRRKATGRLSWRGRTLPAAAHG